MQNTDSASNSSLTVDTAFRPIQVTEKQVLSYLTKLQKEGAQFFIRKPDKTVKKIQIPKLHSIRTVKRWKSRTIRQYKYKSIGGQADLSKLTDYILNEKKQGAEFYVKKPSGEIKKFEFSIISPEQL